MSFSLEKAFALQELFVPNLTSKAFCTSKMVPVVQNWTISLRCQEFYVQRFCMCTYVHPSIETKVADGNVIEKSEERQFSSSKFLISNSRLQSRMSQYQRLQAKNCWIWIKKPKENHWIEMGPGNHVEKYHISSSIFPGCSYPPRRFQVNFLNEQKCERNMMKLTKGIHS